MPFVETINASDIIEALIVNIKADHDFWNVDPVERAKLDYTGFRSIRNNRVCQDIEEDSFPVLFVDADEAITLETNITSLIVAENCIIQVSMLYEEDDTKISQIRKKLEIYMASLLQTFNLQVPPNEKIVFYEDVVKSFKTLNIATKVQTV